MYSFIEFLIFLRFNFGESGQYVLEPYKKKKMVVSDVEDEIIFRKNNDKEYMKEDFIELVKVGESLKSSRFRLKFTHGGKYLCVKKPGVKTVSLCGSGEKSQALTWDIEKENDFKKFKIHNRCLARVGGLITSMKLRIQKCRLRKGQKWNLIPYDVPTEGAPSKMNKSVEKAEEDTSSDEKSEEDPKIVPDSILKQMENPETRNKSLAENDQILRDKLENIAPQFVYKNEESSSDIAHLMRKPSATDKSPQILPDDLARWQMDQKLNFEYHPPNNNSPRGEIVQIFPKTPIKRADSIYKPILANTKNPKTYLDVDRPKTPEEKRKAVEKRGLPEPNVAGVIKNRIGVGKKHPPQTERKRVSDRVLQKILKKAEKRKKRPKFDPTSPFPYRKNGLGNRPRKQYKIPECCDFEKTDLQMNPDQANPSKAEKIEPPKEPKKNWLEGLISNLNDKKKKAEKLAGVAV